jgi:lipoprotein signal peptidase
MSLALYFGVFAGVIALDQLSKRWAMRALPVADAAGAASSVGWTRTTSRAFDRLGRGGAALLWLLVGAGGAALCIGSGAGMVAALSGIAAWAAAASNLGEWWRRGAVVDWLQLWPRSVSNFADAVLILGSVQLAVWIAAS